MGRFLTSREPGRPVSAYPAPSRSTWAAESVAPETVADDEPRNQGGQEEDLSNVQSPGEPSREAARARWLPGGLAAAQHPAPDPTVKRSPTEAHGAEAWLPEPRAAGSTGGAREVLAQSSPWLLTNEQRSHPRVNHPEHAVGAVSAYCAEFCSPEAAQRVTELILTSSADNAASDQLLRTTRSVAAEHGFQAPTRGRWRGLLAAEHEDICAGVAARLAARANGELGTADADALETHLEDCPRCRAVEQRAARAEAAFAEALEGPPPARWLVAPPTPRKSETAAAAAGLGLGAAWLVRRGEEPPATAASPALVSPPPALVSPPPAPISPPPAPISPLAAPISPWAAPISPPPAPVSPPAAPVSPPPAPAPAQVGVLASGMAGETAEHSASGAASMPPARRGRAIGVLGALGLIAALALAAFLLLSGGSTKAPLASRVSTGKVAPTPLVTPQTAPVHVPKHRAVVRHRHPVLKRAKPRTPAAPSTTVGAQSTTPTTPTPAPTVTPVVTPPPPAPSGAGAGSGRGRGTSVTATPQSGGLPAQSAPTQGIGSGKKP